MPIALTAAPYHGIDDFKHFLAHAVVAPYLQCISAMQMAESEPEGYASDAPTQCLNDLQGPPEHPSKRGRRQFW